MLDVTEGFELTDELREWFAGNGYQVNLVARTRAFIEYYEKRNAKLLRKESWALLWKKWIAADALNPKYIIKPQAPKVIHPGSLEDQSYGEPTPMPENLRSLIRRRKNVSNLNF